MNEWIFDRYFFVSLRFTSALKAYWNNDIPTNSELIPFKTSNWEIKSYNVSL